MRTLKSIFAALFLVSFMSTSFANFNNTSLSTTNEMFIEARSTANHSVNLRLANVQADKLTIRLKDEAGTVLYFEKIKDQTAYFKHFNLSDLPDGNYHFTISQVNVDDAVKTFSIEGGIVQIDYIKTVFPTVVSNCALKVSCKDKDTATVHLMNNTSQKVTMRLKDQNGKVWFFEKVASNDSFQKRLILSELPDGSYTFTIEETTAQTEQKLNIKNGVAQIVKDIPRA